MDKTLNYKIKCVRYKYVNTKNIEHSIIFIFINICLYI